MSLTMENFEEFDRHNSKYKQFKIRNTRRTSTPQLVRPKHIRSNIQSDLPMQVRSPPSSKCPDVDVDTTYVSYVQWRHYLVVPNSARKFKVRCIDTNVQLHTCDTAISGNINMLPFPSTPAIKSNKMFGRTASTPKATKLSKVEDVLNSRIILGDNMADLREELGRRNQRIVDAVVPMIKKSLKRLMVGDTGKTAEPVRSKTAKIFGGFSLRFRKDANEDREFLIDCNDNEE